jgi:hypothetical protein
MGIFQTFGLFLTILLFYLFLMEDCGVFSQPDVLLLLAVAIFAHLKPKYSLRK